MQPSNTEPLAAELLLRSREFVARHKVPTAAYFRLPELLLRRRKFTGTLQSQRTHAAEGIFGKLSRKEGIISVSKVHSSNTEPLAAELLLRRREFAGGRQSVYNCGPMQPVAKGSPSTAATQSHSQQSFS